MSTAVSTPTQLDPGTPPALRMALRLLEEGYWPVPIHPTNDNDGKSSGKRPIGVEWGVKKHTPETLRKTWTNHPNAGVGLLLGKQGGVIDFDVDDPETGDDTFLRVTGGEICDTFGWSSERGYHALFKWDDRLTKYNVAVARNHPNYPGLELRLGDDGSSGKQYQTVVPPSPDTKGKPREWNGIREIAELPECVFRDFDRYLVEHHTEPVNVPTNQSLGLVVSAPSTSGPIDILERARRYIAKMPESIAGQAGHDRLYNVACVLVGDFLLTYEQSLPIFREWNALYAKPPENAKQVEHKLADACKHAEKSGRLVGERQSVEVVPVKVDSDLYSESNLAVGRANIATADDLAVAQSGIEWAWEGWIQKGTLCLLAAEGGTGKTRLMLDLAKRVYLGLPWPDGSDQTYPPGSVVLWIPADNNHSELAENPPKFGFPRGAIFLNTSKEDLFGGTELQTPEQLARLEWHVRCVQPAFVVIDTITNTSDAKSQDTSDAKRQYKPLQEIASRTGVPIVCITHLNSGGKTLGRRADEKVRTSIRMTWPDPEGQPNRRKLQVTKSNSLMPPALGVTMGDAGNEYDFEPPKEPDNQSEVFVGGGQQRSESTGMNRIQAATKWLQEQLAFGTMYLKDILQAGSANGYDAKLLYRAKDALKLNEFTTDGRKQWELT